MRIEIITWDDAFVLPGGCDIADAANVHGIRTHTVGWVIGENKNGVTLATDVYEVDKTQAHTPIFIPLGMIVKRTKLAQPKGKKKCQR